MKHKSLYTIKLRLFKTNWKTNYSITDTVVIPREHFLFLGLTNHSCIPNTRQVFTSDKRLMFIAVKPIAKGEELTTSYCPLLWATPLRITFLFKTKHFICNCPRCQDATVSKQFYDMSHYILLVFNRIIFFFFNFTCKSSDQHGFNRFVHNLTSF